MRHRSTREQLTSVVEPPIWKRKSPPRVIMTDPHPHTYGLNHLSPGLRSLVLRFEQAVRSDYASNSIDQSVDATHYRNAKRALVRKLRRLEGTLKPDTRGRRAPSFHELDTST